MNRALLARQICVTGSIGSGKSRVARVLADLLQLPFIDVDDIAKELMNVGGVGLQAVQRYNPAFLNADGSLNRSLLRTGIFNSIVVKRDIDALLHPLIKTALINRLQLEKKRAIIEIPLLFEAGWDAWFDTIIVVSASRDTCVKRISQRDSVSIEAAEKAHDSQMDTIKKIDMAMFVIDNDMSWPETVMSIKDIALKLSAK